MGAREADNLKIVELKVSVNCCEGCKRKVLKALSIKGVLKTDIHPSLPKVTVYGSVDPQTLIKKLSKCGKTAELCHSEETKPTIPHSDSTTGAQQEKANGCIEDEGKQQSSTKSSNKTSNSNKKKKKEVGDKDGDQITSKDHKEASESVTDQAVFPAAVMTTVPQVSYVVSPSPGDNVLASHARVYYPMEPQTVLPTPYYTTVSTHYTAPPPCYIPDNYQYEMPVYRTPPPMQQEAMGFSDYFNDDNTVGCRVM
ncbi:hypothetical protein J5N97_021447 [Dioscorea zingiberensis]|uniref:HMA domain-containing protein n=1 Tax=Dioscorea zingiberensis TaxID=325984 RepID=A0A9D5HEM2_9LILI|nr:hypothetical protein J5N97_021447 [Dioscorea zingiberensis]